MPFRDFIRKQENKHVDTVCETEEPREGVSQRNVPMYEGDRIPSGFIQRLVAQYECIRRTEIGDPVGCYTINTSQLRNATQPSRSDSSSQQQEDFPPHPTVEWRFLPEDYDYPW